MNKILLLFIALIGLSFTVQAQSTLSGTVSDGSDKQKLKNAVIMLLNPSDSLLLDYTRSDANGSFTLKRPANNEYLIIVSYPKYADFFQNIRKESTGNLGDIKLMSVAHLIEEVVVNRRSAITIKGDTTEYDASQFKVEKNAKVEDLLKTFPGISVDASGKITAQGKTVQKVLVDGEEFFGNDPTLVTRNLRADMVDKVQVYEKKSDQSERTGVDDGVREQTINVKLKDDAKNGLFGKALAGGGTDEYYMGQLMLNKFKGSQKISAYGLIGNNGTTSMNWEDAQKYGAVVDASFENGAMVVNDPFSGQGVIGIPRAINTGVNFTDRWKGDKYQVNLNYKYGKLSSDGEEKTDMSGVINSKQKKIVDTDNDQHRVNLRLNTKIDSLNEVLITGGATRKTLWSDSEINSENSSSSNVLESKNKSREIVENDINNYNVGLLYTKKFLKKGRSISFNGGLSKNETVGGGFLNSTLIKYDNNVPTEIPTDQRKETQQNFVGTEAGVTYTEPLSSKINLSIGYKFSNSANESLLESYNKDQTGKYTVLDDQFSSNYDFNSARNNYNVSLGYVADKIRLNLANNFNDDRLKQVNNYDSRTLNRDFFTYNPRLTANYNFSSAKALRVSYSGTNNLPSLTQIQPILNNSDPLNFYEGNENLNPAFTNNIETFYHSFNMLANQFKYIGGSLNFTKDPISQNITSNDGVNYYRWDNVNGKRDLSLAVYSGYHFRLHKELSIENSVQLVFSVNENNNFFNGDANEVNSQNYSFAYEIKRETKTGFNFSTKFTPQYRQMTSNLRPDQNNNGFVFGSTGSLEYFFTKSFKIYTNYDYSYEAPTDAFDQKLERFLVHPGISKKFLKNESLVLDFTINDVLNQNVGYSRAQSNSVFVQRRFDTIRRYYMLKLSWDFTKMFVKN